MVSGFLKSCLMNSNVLSSMCCETLFSHDPSHNNTEQCTPRTGCNHGVPSTCPESATTPFVGVRSRSFSTSCCFESLAYRYFLPVQSLGRCKNTRIYI